MVNEFVRRPGRLREPGPGPAETADENIKTKLEQGVKSWNRWRERNPDARIVLREADLGGIDLSGALLEGADFGQAFLSGARLVGAKLRGADLSAAELSGADLARADLRRANLHRADLTGAELAAADLSGASLGEATLDRVGAAEANLSEADLTAASLGRADLSRAVLIRAKLKRAALQAADLTGADLTGALLVRANLTEADLGGANLRAAVLRGTILGHANLAGATGLEAVVHRGPSVVDQGTLARSGSLPLAFLRGCGLSDALIDGLPSLIGEARSPHCHVGYASADSPFALRLHDRLQELGFRCWLHELPPAGEHLEVSLRPGDKLLLCCSAQSLRSAWLGPGLDRVLAAERAVWKQSGQRAGAIVPVALDGDLAGWEDRRAAELKRRLAADFSGWEDDSRRFETQLARLLEALRA